MASQSNHVINSERNTWNQAANNRQCPKCGGRLMFTARGIGGVDREELRCGCGLRLWHEYRLTEVGRMVSMGAGYLAAPLSDGSTPQLKQDERWGISQ
jgi:hypothetical protein